MSQPREREREREGRLKRWFYRKIVEADIFRFSYLQLFVHAPYVITRKIVHLLRKCSFEWATSVTFKKRWLKTNPDGSQYFDIRGAKLPLLSKKSHLQMFASYISLDTFLFSAYYNDNYEKSLVERLDPAMSEGPYGYTDLPFDVTVKENDIVIDAGAWIGDFSAYAASKNAICYAFEPTSETYKILRQTAELNDNRIIPVQKGLGDREYETKIYFGEASGGANSIYNHSATENSETIQITTIDRFVEENKIERIDFIKSDIEGAERDMLKGAKNTLAKFAPKLAICTYHLPDDPVVLTQLILEANPKYKIVYLRHKLFACVIDR